MEILINLISLVIALVSLIVAVIALRISKVVVKYSSRDYLPDLAWKIDDQDILFLQNKSVKLFTILQVGLLKINYFGYEDREKQATVKVPFITNSRMRNDFQKESSITISNDTAFACCHVCPYDEKKIKFIGDKINSFIKQRETKSYLPSLQSVTYLIEILYSNAFNENKIIYFMRKHYLGSGDNDSSISEKQFFDIIQHANIPAFERNDELWDYIGEKYTTKFILHKDKTV